MDEHAIPENMSDVRDRVVLMQARGFDVTEDDVIKEAIRAGFQDIVDERADGAYFTVRWDENSTELLVLGIDSELEGKAVPTEKIGSYTEKFKESPSDVWFALDAAVRKIIGR